MKELVNITLVNKILTIALVIIVLPILLHFVPPILIPAMLIIGLNFSWLVGGMFSVIGLLAVVVGLVATIWFLTIRRRINDHQTLLLGKWVVGLTAIYVTIFIVMVLFSLVASRLY